MSIMSISFEVYLPEIIGRLMRALLRNWKRPVIWERLQVTAGASTSTVDS